MYNDSFSALNFDKKHFVINNKHSRKLSVSQSVSQFIKPRNLDLIKRMIRTHPADAGTELHHHLDQGKQLIGYLSREEITKYLTIYQSI